MLETNRPILRANDESIVRRIIAAALAAIAVPFVVLGDLVLKVLDDVFGKKFVGMSK